VPAKIPGLIDKLDAFERVRDKVGEILVVEEANQRQLAIDAGKDPDLWSLQIYLERSEPWAEFLDPEDDEKTDGKPRQRKTPIVNVWFDNYQIALNASNVVERQRYSAVINIDCYGYGRSEETDDGHSPADAKSAREAQRAARLVRNILMSAIYTYLDLRGTVARRWVQSIQQFQPRNGGESVQAVTGSRVALHVDLHETSPQVEGEILEAISVDVNRQPDGLLYLTATFPQE
jgi:hypothetical protein